MKKRIVFSLIITLLFIYSCEDCEDETIHYHAEFYTVMRNTDNDWWDWDRNYEVTSDTVSFGIETEYSVCEAYSAEELNTETYEFYTDSIIIIENDTILPKMNLLDNEKTSDYLLLIKSDASSFTSAPQYILSLDNKDLKFEDFHTFYFRGFTKSGAEISDSTIVYFK